MLEIRDEQLEALRATVRGGFPDTVFAALRAAGFEAVRGDGIITATDARGYDTSLSLAADGAPQRLTLPSGSFYDLTLDPAGRLATLKHSGGARVEVEHDAATGYVSKLRRPGVDEHRFLYDRDANLAAVRYPDESQEAFEYDHESRLVARIARSGARTEYVRSADGKLQAITDPLGRQTRFEYEDGALHAVVFPDGSAEAYAFDADLQVGRVTRRDGSVVYQSLTAGVVSDVSWDDGSYVHFDVRDGRLQGAHDDGGFVSFEHGPTGETIREKTPEGIVKLAYDPEGRVTQLSTPHGDTIHYSYDPDGRLETIRDWDGRLSRFRYAEDGTVNQITYGNGLVERQRYAATGRLAHARVRGATRGDKRVLSEQRYEYDRCGRLTQIEDAHPRDGWQRRIHLDIDGRVTRVIDGAGRLLESFEYDAKGNMVRDGVNALAVGAMDELLRHGEDALSYDGLGNVVALPSPMGAMSCRYADNGVLAETRVGDTVVRYQYDALGRRVGKSDGTHSWRYGYVGHQLLWEEHQEGPGARAVRRDYLWCPDGVVPVAFRERGRTYWIQADARGAPVRVFDKNGDVVWSARYDAFGQAHVEIARVRQPWRLAGQYHDDDTGLCYQLCRYYAPWLKTYLARDPFWHKGGATNYSYAANQPYDYVDPFGGLAFLAVAAIAVGVGALVGGVIGGVVKAAQGGSLREIAGAAAAGAIEGAGAVIGGIVGGLVGGPVGLVAGAMVGGVAGTFVGTLAEQAINGEPLCLKCAANAALVAGLIDIALLGLGKIPGVKRIVRAVGDKLASKGAAIKDWASGKLRDAWRRARPQQAAQRSRDWGKKMADSAPPQDPATVAKEQKLLQDRVELLDENYKKVMAGEMELPPHISKERLKLAVEGGPDGRRVPLNWQSREQFDQFRKELQEELAAAGIKDAKVVQIGSATTGWQGNPHKIPPKFWQPTSDADFAIYSPKALEQAMDIGAPVNQKVIMNGKYSIVKNTTPEGTGFSNTAAGERLDAFSKKWNKILYGKEDVDGVDFKLNLLDEALPMSTPILP